VYVRIVGYVPECCILVRARTHVCTRILGIPWHGIHIPLWEGSGDIPYPPDAILGILANALYVISRPETSIWRVILEPSDGVPTHPGVLWIPLPEDLWSLWTHLVACHMAYAMYRTHSMGRSVHMGWDLVPSWWDVCRVCMDRCQYILLLVLLL
jgi:hypothetical protein